MVQRLQAAWPPNSFTIHCWHAHFCVLVWLCSCQNFTVIAGLLVTAVAQFLVEGIAPSSVVLLALPLVVASTLLYSFFPPAKRENMKTE